VALSRDGSRAYACRGDQCDLLAIDTATGRTVAGPLRLGYDPESMAVSADGSRLYAAFFASGEAGDLLLAVDTRTLKAVGGHAPLGSGPHLNVAVSPDGRRVYVGNYVGESVSVIDSQGMRLVGTPVPVGGPAGGVAVSPDGRRVYVTLALEPTIATFRADSPGTVSLIPVG